MASTPSKPRKPRTKPPRGRPLATSTISQPAVADSSSLTYLSTFSPLGNLFALLSLAVDKSQLRVYDTGTRQCVAEHLVDAARVTSLCWARFDPSEPRKQAGDDDADAQQPRRKRKKRNSVPANAVPAASAPQLVVLGLSDGSLVLFSPTHGRIVRTLSHPASGAAILSVAVDAAGGEHSSTIWASTADGKIHLWDASKNDILSTWTSDDRNPYTALAVRPSTDEEGRTDILAAHHSMRLLSMLTGSSESQLSEKQKPKELANFTGHASNVKDVQWSGSSRFLSIAEADRFVNVWDVPDAQASEGKMVASVPLDSDARCISLSPHGAASQEQILLTVSAAGKISVFPLASELKEKSPSKSKHKVATLAPKSNISVSSSSDAIQVVAASFSAGEGRIRVARLVNGIRPAFDVVTYLTEGGDYIQDVVIPDSSSSLASGPDVSGAPVRRYNESSSLVVRSGAELGQDATMDDLPMRDADGELDADLAELSLGQRLTALTGVENAGRSGSGSDDEVDISSARPSARKQKGKDAVQAVPAGSLTRTLIQALHSSDAGLLETCLAHSDAALIRNTVRRLPPQLAVPLITACVERLGRGARGGNMKGGGGGASSQRGTALISWVKAVLATHSGHLMTMPDLLARLSGLHATLTMRLALQDSLLALSGRLDMVISQIEMRASGPPAPLPMPKSKGKETQKREARRYIEGESEAEEEDEQMEVDVESGDDGGSVEDIELGGSDEEEEEDSEDDEEEDDEDEDEGLGINGFIDDEAEEEYSEEDDEDSE